MSDHGPNVRAAKAEILLEDARKRIEELECHLAISRGKHENCIAENERLREALAVYAKKYPHAQAVLEKNNESHQD